MADNDRMPGEPRFEDLQVRIRTWLQWRWRDLKSRRPDVTQADFARSLALSKQYVGDLLKGEELPSLECYMKMHFRLGLDAYRMLHADPDEMVEIAPPPTAPHATKRAARK